MILCDVVYCTVATPLFCVYKTITVVFQVEKLESECSQLQQELQDSKDQNELLEFRILELEVSSLPTLLFRSCILGFSLAENNTLNRLLQWTGSLVFPDYFRFCF